VNYELRNANSAIQMLMYERDQADTAACAAEIARLAASGYAVTDYNVGELKGKRTPADRAAYVQHIVTSYSKIGTEQMPPLLGDPTAGPAEPANRPATKEEMEAALKYMSASGQKDFGTALNYVRGAGQPAMTPYSDARLFPQYPAQYPPAAPHAALPNTQGPPFGPGADPDAGLLAAMPANPYAHDGGPSANGYGNPYV
jgi:hypothetical protein